MTSLERPGRARGLRSCVLLLGLVLAGLAGPASAVKFENGAAVSYTVPAGVTQVKVIMAGGGGGRGGADDNGCCGEGGGPAKIEALINVTPGQVFSGVTARRGGDGFTSPNGQGATGPAGGSGQGSGGKGGNPGVHDHSGTGGGGGGGTALALGSSATNRTFILNAAGGGGGQGGSWDVVGLAGGNATAFTSAANCSLSGTGSAGGNVTGLSPSNAPRNPSQNDGGGGGGGGGGYIGGSGGGSHYDGLSGGSASSGGTSCISSTSGLFATPPTRSLENWASPGYVIIEVINELSISKSDGVTLVPSGGQTTYTIRVTNDGPYSVTDSQFADPTVTQLPKTAVSCSAAPGKCVTPPTIAQLESGSFLLPTLAVGEFYEISVTVNVRSGTADSVSNSAWIQPPADFVSSGGSCTNTGLPSGVSRSFDSSASRCTVTDTDNITRASVKLVKSTRPTAFDQAFSVTPTANFTTSTAATINAGTSTTAAFLLTEPSVEAKLTEAAVQGWRGASMRCVAETALHGETSGATVFSSSTAGSINTAYVTTIPPNTFKGGNNYTCTLGNDAARVRYQKTTLPANQNQDFKIAPFNNSSITTDHTINATTGASAYFLILTPQNAGTLTERATSGWTGQSLSCVADTGNNGVTQGAVIADASRSDAGTLGAAYTKSVPANTFVPGNDYSCTWANSAVQVALIKKTAPADGVDKDFPLSLSNFTNTTATINAAGTTSVVRTLSNPAAATTLNESAVTGWRSKSLSCVASTANNGETVGNVAYSATAPAALNTGSATSTYQAPANAFKAGNQYNCTYVNETTRVRYRKATLPANQNQNFTIAAFNGVAQQTAVNATTGPTAYLTINTPQTTANLTENGLAGWTPQSLSCVADTGNNGETQGAAIADASRSDAGTAGTAYTKSVPGGTFKIGNDYSCTWTNAATRLTLIKKTVPVDGFNQNFTINLSNLASGETTSATINAGAATTATRTLSGTTAATNINEAAQSGWRGKSVSCKAVTGNNGETAGTEIFSNTVAAATANSAYNNQIPANAMKAGNEYACTFSNDAALLRLAKSTQPVEGVNQSFSNNNASNGLTSTGMNFNAATGPSGYVAITSVTATTQPREAAITNWRGTGLVCRNDATGTSVYTSTTLGTVSTQYTPSPAIPASTFALGSSYTCTFSNEVRKPILTKSFDPTTIAIGGTTTLTFKIVNPSGAAAASGMTFTDTLPAGLVLKSAPAASQCGGTVSGSAGGGTISLSGGNLGAGLSECTIVVSVTNAATQGVASCPNPSTTNGSGNISGLAGGVVNGVSDQCVNIIAAFGKPKLTLSKVSVGGTGTFVFNGSDPAANGFPTDDSYAITTLTAGAPQTGAQITLAGVNSTTEIVEKLPAGWKLGSASCVDNNAAISGNASTPLALDVVDGNRIRIPQQYTKTAADLRCTVTNMPVGATLSGKVVLDNGAGAGIAHDAVQNGEEAGRGGVTVQLTNCATLEQDIVEYGSTVTDPAGAFVLSIETVPPGNVCLIKRPSSAFVAVSANAGNSSGSYDRGKDTLQFALADDTSYSGIVFGEVGTSRLLIDGLRQAEPGSVVDYPHVFEAATSAAVTFSASSNASGSGRWNSVLYQDNNCDAQVGSDDTPLLAPLNVTAGQSVCLINRVFVPSGVGQGAQDVTTVAATEELTPAPVSGPLTFNHSRTDTTTIGQSSLVLTKEVRRLASCPANAAASTALGTPYTTSNQADAGDALEYRITYRNDTSIAVTHVRITDSVPAYTLFQGAWCLTTPTTGVTGCTVTAAPAANAGSGAIVWELQDASAPPAGLMPGMRGEVGFCVRVEN